MGSVDVYSLCSIFVWIPVEQCRMSTKPSSILTGRRFQLRRQERRLESRQEQFSSDDYRNVKIGK